MKILTKPQERTVIGEGANGGTPCPTLLNQTVPCSAPHVHRPILLKPKYILE